jgi:hypothetical protein
MVSSTMSSRFGEGFRRPSDREDIACFSRGQLGLFYLKLSNYQNYFVEAGYEEEVMAARSAIANGDDERLMAAFSERMASDVALFGTKIEVLEKAEAWAAAGITHLVLDCTSTTGDRLKAAYEVIDAFT